jgi:hypothetical protein
MYKTLIYYCNYNNYLPIPKDLLGICKNKPTFIDNSDETNLQIEKMKTNSINFTKNEFLKLVSIISSKNSYYVNINQEFTSSFKKISSYFNLTDSINGVSKEFMRLMKVSLDSYEVEGEEDNVRELRNYLEKTNSKMIDDIIEFIKRQSKTTANELSKFKNFLQNLNKWTDTDTDKLNDSIFTNFTFYMKNLINLFLKTLPKSILTRTHHKLNCPIYWKLSKKHVNDLEKSVNNFYENYNKFFGNDNLIPILDSILIQSSTIIKISNNLVSHLTLNNSKSLFDKRTTGLLLTFYYISSLNMYINTSSKLILENPEQLNIISISDDDTLGEMFYGERKVSKEITSELIKTFIKTSIKIKSQIDFSTKDIEKIVFRLTQAEKNTYIEKFETLEEEERTIENIKKINKLGEWNKGLLKGLKEYDPENYDNERNLMYKISRLERDVVNRYGDLDENQANEAMEREMEENEIELRVDSEERNIRMVRSDNSDGEEDEENNYDDD